MQRDLTAGSRYEHLVLYDPAAIPVDTPTDPDLEAQEPMPLSESVLKQLAARSQALILYHPSPDCEAKIRVFVDEEPPLLHRERGRKVLEGARLKLPNGRAVFDGTEFICKDKEVRSQSLAETMDVPPGEYSIELLNLIPWKTTHRDSYFVKETRPIDRWIDRIISIFVWTFAILIPVNLILVPGILLILWDEKGWRSALIAAGAVAFIDALIIAGFWILEFLAKRFPALKRASNVRLHFEEENPDVVVVLQQSSAFENFSTPGWAVVELS